MSELTSEDVRRRAAVAGITLREDRVEMVRRLLSDALAPLRRMDANAMRTSEPAATFDAAPGGHDGGR